jgi:hypothetical protein
VGVVLGENVRAYGCTTMKVSSDLHADAYADAAVDRVEVLTELTSVEKWCDAPKLVDDGRIRIPILSTSRDGGEPHGCT